MSSSDKIFKNAEELIDRFGGIRPMSHKTDVPVTTIQGWKKRNSVPDNRTAEIIEAAREYGIDVQDILQDRGGGDENGGTEASDIPAANQNEGDGAGDAHKTFARVQENEDIMKKINELEEKLTAQQKSAVSSTLWMGVAVLVFGLAGFLFLFFRQPVPGENAAVPPSELGAVREDLEQLQNDVETIKEEQGFLAGLVPDDLGRRLQDLQAEAQSARENVEGVLAEAQSASEAFLGGNTEELSARVAELEARLQELTSGPVIGNLISRFQSWQDTESGQNRLDSSVNELNDLLATLGTQSEGGLEWSGDQVNSVLQTAREQSTTLNETFEGVPQEELRAAALLLAMNQFRSALNRDNKPFEEDLALLQKLTGEDNEALQASLEKLAPHAESGVLTVNGLSSELRSLAGEAVVASLQGEDVSIQERAQARFNEILQIEKDGELITGTPTQERLDLAQKELEAGDVEGAIEAVKSLEGPALELLQPWIDEAQATLSAQQFKGILNRGLTGAESGQPLNPRTLGGGRLIQNEEYGVNIYRP